MSYITLRVSLPDSFFFVQTGVTGFHPSAFKACYLRATLISAQQKQASLILSSFLYMRNKGGHFTAARLNPRSVARQDEHNIAVVMYDLEKVTKNIATRIGSDQ